MTTIGICDRRFQRSSFVTITSAPCSGRLLSVRHLGFVARYCQLAVGCAFTNVLVNRIDCHSLGVAENAPVIASQIVSTAAQRFDEYFQKRQNAGHTTGQPLGNGVEKLIRSSQVLDVFLKIVDKGRTVESDRLAGDSGGQLSHESRSASTYSCASWFCQTSLPRPRSSVISCFGSAVGSVSALTRRRRSSAGRWLAASISSSTLSVRDIITSSSCKSSTGRCPQARPRPRRSERRPTNSGHVGLARRC